MDVGPPRQRSVLAALVVDAGRPVSVDTLVDRIWGQTAPDGVRQALYVYIARIRRLIRLAGIPDGGAPRLVRRSGGYLLDIDEGQVDLHVFRTLVVQARDQDCPDPRRVAHLHAALTLWRGTPLAGVAGDWAERVRAGWQQQRLEAVTSWAQAELRLGNPGSVVGPLIDATTEHPLVEPLTAVLMRALYATGRGSEALDCYTRTRQRLVDELGVDAGTELQRLQQVILCGEPDPWPIAPSSHDSARTTSAPATVPEAVPAQLPLDVYGFTGRSGELGQLDAILAAGGEQPTAMVVSVLSGTAGVGKTALAVHWAHQVADRFPDGQLYVNLRGFDPDGGAMDPSQAVRGFLDAFAVPPQRVPATVEAQVGLYRSLLAGRRVLVVLDNAIDADQIRPLLPGAPGCLALVTSRNQLPGLVAAQGAHPLTLGLLSDAEARNLLARRVGVSRMSIEEAAIDEIIVHCAQLPLALAIVAARIANEPTLSLAALATELRAAQGGLDAFDGEDAATDVRTVFSWSYRSLSPDAARLFRLLGLHPGPDVATAALASLAGATVEEVGTQLSELARANLITEQIAGRISSHDLLRAYAMELAGQLDSDGQRRSARHRLLDHYLHSTNAAAVRLYPSRDPVDLGPAPPGVRPEHPADNGQALAWVAAERPVLLATIGQARNMGFEEYAWRLATALTEYLDRAGHWQDWLEAHRTALDAGIHLADLGGQAQAHRGLGRAYLRLGQPDEAWRHFASALELYSHLGDHGGQAKAHRGLARILDEQGRFREALYHAEETLKGYQAANHESGQANSLNAIGWFHCELGDYRQALERCEEALALLRKLDDPHGEAATLDSLGYVHHHLRDFPQAILCYQRALDLHHELGDRYQETIVLAHLGDTHEAAGDHDAAVTAWERALSILDRLGHPDAAQLRERLHYGVDSR